MFRLFKRKSTGGYLRPEERLSPVPGAYGRMEAPRPHDPTPEYIDEAPEAPEDVWAREEARFRAKNEQETPPPDAHGSG